MSYNYHNMLAHKIRLQRNQKQLTLRDLAEITSLSHSYIHRIEQGVLIPSKKTYDRIKKALDIVFYDDDTVVEAFVKDHEVLYNYLIYSNYTAGKSIARRMYQEREKYENSAVFISYYLIMLMYAQNAVDITNIKVDYYQKLKYLSSAFTPHQKELFLLASGMYFYDEEQNVDKATEQLESLIDVGEHADLLSLATFFLGYIQSKDYRKFRVSLKHLYRARMLYQDQNNFSRVMHTKVSEQLLCIYMERDRDFLTLNNDTFQYAEIKGRPKLYRASSKNRVIYYVMKQSYSEALKILMQFDNHKEEDFVFLKIYVLYKLKRYVHALSLIDFFEREITIEPTALYKDAVNCVKTCILKAPDADLTVLVKAFANHALSVRNYLMVTISFALATELFIVFRKYKEAYLFTNKQLNIVREIIGEGVFDEA